MNASAPAFPGEKNERFGQPNDCNEGMSMLDYFAAAALTGMCAGVAANYTKGADNHTLASRAYNIAEAMIEKRNQ